jgi:hypothetical protein
MNDKDETQAIVYFSDETTHVVTVWNPPPEEFTTCNPNSMKNIQVRRSGVNKKGLPVYRENFLPSAFENKVAIAQEELNDFAMYLGKTIGFLNRKSLRKLMAKKIGEEIVEEAELALYALASAFYKKKDKDE